jgi:hypothetical protein
MVNMAFGFWLGLIIAFVFWANDGWSIRPDLISRGLAEYCPTDGDFAFKGECK